MLIQMILVPTFVLVGLTFLLLFRNGNKGEGPERDLPVTAVGPIISTHCSTFWLR